LCEEMMVGFVGPCVRFTPSKHPYVRVVQDVHA